MVIMQICIHSLMCTKCEWDISTKKLSFRYLETFCLHRQFARVSNNLSRDVDHLSVFSTLEQTEFSSLTPKFRSTNESRPHVWKRLQNPSTPGISRKPPLFLLLITRKTSPYFRFWKFGDRRKIEFSGARDSLQHSEIHYNTKWSPLSFSD